MKLLLAVALSCTDPACRVKLLDTQDDVRAPRSGAMIEHDIAVRPGQLVAIEKRPALSRIVYRWPDVEVIQTPGGGYALRRDGQPLDPDRLRRDAFPEIEAMYALMEKAQAISPRQVVREGYDRIAERYVEWVQDRSEVRTRYTDLLLDGLPPGAEVLDLGCGAGGPTTLALFARHYDEVWTKERMMCIIDAARERNIALEIQENIRIPTPEFVALAKKAGIKFTFGTNARNDNAGRFKYCLDVARECGLTEDDMFTIDHKE